MCSSLGMKNFKYIAFWHGWLPHRSKNVLLAWGLEPRVSTAPQESAQVPGRAAWPLTEHHSYFCESVTKRGRQEGERMGCGRHTEARSMIFQLQDFTYQKQMLQVPARAAPVKQERQERTDPTLCSLPLLSLQGWRLMQDRRGGPQGTVFSQLDCFKVSSLSSIFVRGGKEQRKWQREGSLSGKLGRCSLESWVCG